MSTTLSKVNIIYIYICSNNAKTFALQIICLCVRLSGVPDEREGLFDTIQRSKNHYQKRAYQCIKCIVQLFSKCTLAHQLLYHSVDLKKKWVHAIDWLQDELDKVTCHLPPSLPLSSLCHLFIINIYQRPYTSAAPYTHAYDNWSPPAQSNESTTGYFLERSNSARKTLERAFELCQDDEQPIIVDATEDSDNDTSIIRRDGSFMRRRANLDNDASIIRERGNSDNDTFFVRRWGYSDNNTSIVRRRRSSER